MFTVPMLDKLKIDDVVGAISVHLFTGIWGSLAVAIFGAGDLMVQITGIVAIGLYAFAASFVLFVILKLAMGIRCTEEAEMLGLDRAKLGLEAYPEFGTGSQKFGD